MRVSRLPLAIQSHVDPPRFDRAILVVGASLGSGGELLPGLVSRLETALRLSREDPHAVLLLSGGGAGPEPESHVMARWLLEHGVSSERIIIEDRSHNTRANMTESVPILATLGVSSVTLVTERFHMKRSRVVLDMVMRQSGLAGVSLHTVRAPNRNLEAAAREAPVPLRDHRVQTRAWRDVPRLDMNGQLPPPKALVQGVAAAFARPGKNVLILPSSE